MKTGQKRHAARFRRCVAAVILNARGEILVASRIDFPGSWQFPQGGCDPGETEIQAVLREVREELGTDKVRLLRKSARLRRYRFLVNPDGRMKSFAGQSQRYFLLEFVGKDSDINLLSTHPEFNAWKWVRPEAFSMDTVYPPKRPVFGSVLREFFKIKTPAHAPKTAKKNPRKKARQ